jgi:hypothetical protein
VRRGQSGQWRFRAAILRGEDQSRTGC